MAFTPKSVPTQKKPKLSQEMQKLIDRSHYENDSGIKYDDVERYKYVIMDKLTSNPDILWTLNNEELENKMVEGQENPNGDEYRDVNIFNFLKVPDIQSTVKNMVCFEVNISEEARYNRNAKRNEALAIVNIIFRTISHEQDVKTDYGIARQDLLAAIVKSEFDWSNMFGCHINLLYDKGRVAENGYYYREFIYECTTASNLINKSENGGVSYGRD